MAWLKRDDAAEDSGMGATSAAAPSEESAGLDTDLARLERQRATGVVTVHGAASATASATPNAVGITPQGGDIVVAFVGLPGGSYRVQFTDDTSPPYAWQEFSPPAVHVAAPNGVFSHTDVAPSSPARLYRAVLNP